MPASYHSVQYAGWGPGASAYNPPACAEHPRIQSLLVVAMRTAKQQGNWAIATRFLEYFTMGGWSFLVVICLFLLRRRFPLDGFLRRTSVTKRCILHFEFFLLLSAIYPETISEKKKKIADDVLCFFLLNCETGSMTRCNSKPTRLKRRWVTILLYIYCIWALKVVSK